MQCFVYRSSRRADTYLYLARRDDFSGVPVSLLDLLGRPEFALEFELTADRRLAQEDATTVLANLKTQGYHVQLPRDQGEDDLPN
jgi:uncharacterized protein YcgL (UPF0745 family)